jgi:hypothetical protein
MTRRKMLALAQVVLEKGISIQFVFRKMVRKNETYTYNLAMMDETYLYYKYFII